MGRKTNAVAGITLAAFGFSLYDEAKHGMANVQPHAPANLYANAVLVSSLSNIPTSTGTAAAFDCNSFRVFYSQGIEVLSDDVSRLGQVRALLDNLTVDALAWGRTTGRTRSA